MLNFPKWVDHMKNICADTTRFHICLAIKRDKNVAIKKMTVTERQTRYNQIYKYGSAYFKALAWFRNRLASVDIFVCFGKRLASRSEKKPFSRYAYVSSFSERVRHKFRVVLHRYTHVYFFHHDCKILSTNPEIAHRDITQMDVASWNVTAEYTGGMGGKSTSPQAYIRA